MNVSPEMYLNIATRLHDQAPTSKESTEGEILFFLLGCNFMVGSSNTGYRPNLNPWSEKINP